MVVVVVWVGRGGWGQGGHAHDAVFGVIFWAVGATSAAGHQTGKIGLCVIHAVYLFSVICEGNTNEEGINKQGEIVKLYMVSMLSWAQNDPLNACYQIPSHHKLTSIRQPRKVATAVWETDNSLYILYGFNSLAAAE